MTEGAVQSNHARITAAAAAIAGLRSVLVLDARHGSEVAGNLPSIISWERRFASSPTRRPVPRSWRRLATSCARPASDPT